MRSIPITRPVFNLQAGHSSELTHIPGYHRQIMHKSDCSDLKIHRADNTSPFFKIMADRSIKIRTTVVERKWNHLAKCPDNITFSQSGIFILFRTMHQFRTNGRACRQFVWPRLEESLHQPKVFSFENFDPYIGVEEVTHHQVFAGGKGSSGGSSNSMSAQHPMISARSGRLRFISSILSGSFLSSASEIASRTRDSKTLAFSGSKRSRVLSSSVVIAVTHKECHQFSIFPIQFFQTPVFH